VLAAIAAMRLMARNSTLAQVSADSLDWLAIELAETVNAVSRANTQAAEELTEVIPHRQQRPVAGAYAHTHILLIATGRIG
jgi:hypothetical protein